MALRPVEPSVPKVMARPLSFEEREELRLALQKTQLPTDDIDEPGRLFWRFERRDQVPVGFGGLEVYGKDALMRSVLTSPLARKRGIGRAIVSGLELEAFVAGCRAIWLATTSAAGFFERLGYERRDRGEVPAAILQTRQLASLCPASATVMTKPLR
jgi:N-acetylglutamate synthase-like GNAT family acetyltransferase